MRLLVLSPTLPYPPTDGGRIRVFNLLRQAAREFETTVLALETEPTDVASLHLLREISIEARLISFSSSPRTPPLSPRAVLRALWGDVPLTVGRYVLPAYRRALEALLASEPFDVVHVEMIHLAPYLGCIRRGTRAPVLLSTQNVDSDVWDRAAPHQPSRWRRALFRWQANVFRRMERRVGCRFDGITAASERDAALWRRVAGSCPVEVIDNGVDLEAYAVQPEAEEPNTCAFTASYDWLPNADAVVHFCSEVWPRIRQRVPNARFYAVGKEPPPSMLRWHGRDGVTVTGRVPEIQPYIAKASVYVVPLRIGGGTRLKILEAMASGKAIVSTPIGCEGLEVTPGRELLVAESPEAFAQSVVALMGDATRRRELGTHARRRVEERYGWEAIGARMNAFYRRLAGTHRPSRKTGLAE